MRSVLSFALVALAGAQIRDFASFGFDEYLAEQQKSYTQEEYVVRKALFDQNLAIVQKHNEQYKAGLHSWWMEMNAFADWKPEEFKRLQSKKHDLPSSDVPIVKALKTQANPETIDWRTKGVVTKVKNQGGCGSCWAFSAIESVESHYALANGKLLTLAPQAYVDCVQNPNQCGGTGGCEGATMELAFNLTKTKGVPLESSLPYRGSDQSCPNYKAAVTVDGYVKNPTNDADALETALATKGPMSITVAAGGIGWQMYGGGTFTGCSKSWFGSGATLDHGVQAVGYTKEYWIVRNSWGAGWGQQGYIYLSRSSDSKTFTDKNPADGVACKPLPKTQTVGGECGCLFDTSYPTGAKAATDESDATLII